MIKNFFKQQVLETYFFFVAPLLSYAALIIINRQTIGDIIAEAKKTFAFYLFFGNDFLLIASLTFYCYLFGKITEYCLRYAEYIIKKTEKPRSLAPLIKSICFIIFSIGVGTFVHITILDNIGHLDAVVVAHATETLMRWDYKIFGFYPVIALQALQKIPFVDSAFILVYQSIGIIMSLLAIALCIKNKTLWRMYIISVMLASTLSLPIWRLYPAISPNEMYLENITKTEAAIATQQVHNVNLSTKLTAFLEKLRGHWSIPEKGLFAITTFPSMHVAWGILIVYFCVLLWRPLAYIAVPWAIMNTISTVYVFEHYAVDAFAGLFMAILAIIITKKLLAFEKQYYIGTYTEFAAIDAVQEDTKKIATILKEMHR